MIGAALGIGATCMLPLVSGMPPVTVVICFAR
jgi:hypothetical protein